MYRLKAGKFAYVSSAYPLGLQPDQQRTSKSADSRLTRPKLSVKGEPPPSTEPAIRVRPKGAFNEVTLAVGHDPEVCAAGTNTAWKTAQSVRYPVHNQWQAE